MVGISSISAIPHLTCYRFSNCNITTSKVVIFDYSVYTNGNQKYYTLLIQIRF